MPSTSLDQLMNEFSRLDINQMRSNALGTCRCLNVDEKRGFLFVCRLANVGRLVSIREAIQTKRLFVDEGKGNVNGQLNARTSSPLRKTVNWVVIATILSPLLKNVSQKCGMKVSSRAEIRVFHVLLQSNSTKTVVAFFYQFASFGL